MVRWSHALGVALTIVSVACHAQGEQRFGAWTLQGPPSASGLHCPAVLRAGSTTRAAPVELHLAPDNTGGILVLPTTAHVLAAAQSSAATGWIASVEAAGRAIGTLEGDAAAARFSLTVELPEGGCRVSTPSVEWKPTAARLDQRSVQALRDADAAIAAAHAARAGGRPEQASESFSRARQLRAAVLGEEHADALRAALYRAAIEAEFGADVAAALADTQAFAPRLLELLGDSVGESGDISRHWGNAHLFAGQPYEARPHYERAAAIYRSVYGAGDARVGQILINVAIVWRDSGQAERSLAALDAAAPILRATRGDTHLDLMILQFNRFEGLKKAGRNPEALAAQLDAVGIARRLYPSDHPVVLRAQGALADAYARAGDAAQALRVADEILPQLEARHGTNHRRAVMVRAYRSQALWMLGRREESLALYEEVLQADTSTYGPNGIDTLGSLATLGRRYLAAGDTGKARDYLSRFVDGMEALREHDDLAYGAQQSLLAHYAGYYRELAVADALARDTASSFRISELVKARSLFDTLVARRADALGLLPAGELARLEAARARLAGADKALEAETRVASHPELEARRTEAVRELVAVQRELRARFPRYARVSEAKPADLGAVRAALRDDEVLLSTTFDGARLLLIGVTRATVEQHVVQDAAALESLALAYRHLLAGHSPGTAVWALPDGRFQIAVQRPAGDARRVESPAEPATRLAALLLQPLRPLLAGKRRWTIVPDGVLATVPFEALPWDGAAVAASRSVAYAQSASVYLLLSGRPLQVKRPDTANRLLAFGAPPYGQATSAAAESGVRPDVLMFVRAAERDAQAITRAFDALNLAWPELPGAARELRQIADDFGKARADVVSGAQASEAMLAQMSRSGALKRYRLLHFAAHGYLDLESPLLSALVLNQRDRSAEFDGYVTAGEWLGYQLDSDLIVLSACNTGRGKLQSGEGVMGLPYAMFVAGNRAAVLSLWEVDDAATAEFMRRFYRQLRYAGSPATALAATKRSMASDRRFGQPRHWAAFVLYGANR